MNMQRRSMNKPLLLLVTLLVACTASLHAQANDLFSAARANDVKLTQALINSSANINEQDSQGYTPLILATYNDNFDVAQLLLKHGAATEIKDHAGRTALMGASFKGNEREVKLLLENGANASATDSKGLTSMMYAVMAGRLCVIKTLRARDSEKPQTAAANYN